MKTRLDQLDQLAIDVAKGDFRRLKPLSTSERLYVAMAANRPELLEASNYTLAESIARIGPDWTEELVARWQFRGDPRRFPPGQLTEPASLAASAETIRSS